MRKYLRQQYGRNSMKILVAFIFWFIAPLIALGADFNQPVKMRQDVFLFQRTDSTVGAINALATSGKNVISLTGANPVLNGISDGVDSRILLIENNSGTTLTINDNSGSATSSRRIDTATGSSVLIPATGTASFIYDSTFSKWRIIGVGASASVPSAGIIYSNGSIFTSTTFGGANNLVGVNNTNNGLEYKSVSVGTTGTDFGVSLTTNSFTINLPSASATNRGAVTTAAQTIAGKKSFSSTVAVTATTNQFELTTAGGGIFTITTASSASNRSLQIVDPGATANFLFSESTQTANGAMNFANTATGTTIAKFASGTQAADASNQGVVTTAAQTFAGAKTQKMVDSSQSIATAAGTTTLSSTDPTLTVFTGSSTQTVKLPDTSTIAIGYRHIVQNLSTSTTAGSVTIQTSTAALLTSLSGKSTVNSTANNGFMAIFECVSTADNTVSAWQQIGNNTEYYEAQQTTASDTAAHNTWSDGASLSIPPGVWDFSGYADFSIGAASSVSAVLLGISTTSGNSATGLTFGINAFSSPGPDATADKPLYVPGYRVSVTSTTTYYLKIKANFVGGASRPQAAFIFRATRYK